MVSTLSASLNFLLLESNQRLHGEGQSLCPGEPDFMSDQGFGLDRELEILTDHFSYLSAVSRECNHVK